MNGGECQEKIKRISKDISELNKNENDYSNIILDPEKCELNLKRVKDSADINIFFDNNFGFTEPKILIDEIDIKTRSQKLKNWKTPYKIKDILDEDYNTYFNPISNNDSNKNFDKKVLILCHPKKVTGTFEPELTLNNHFYHDEGRFKTLFEDYKLNLKGIPKFDTVDIIPGGTFIAKAFSPKFIEKHINEYDLVMVPDCGGEWEDLIRSRIFNGNIPISLSSDEINKNKTNLINLCLNLSKIVKNGGIIQFGKFISETPCNINDKDFDTFSEALKYNLDNNGFTTEIKYIDEAIGKIMIAIKNENSI